MADLKISQLTAATAPLAGTEVLPIVQSGATVKVSVANLTLGRAVTATSLTLTTGDLLVGKTDASATEGGVIVQKYSAASETAGKIQVVNRIGSGQYIFKGINASGGSVGGVVTTSTTTSFLTVSDYRLKEQVQPMTGALATIEALKPVTYKWKADDSNGQGFIAHELQSAVPDCVIGEKDATRVEQYEVVPAVKDVDGNVVTEAVMSTRTVPDYQGIDTSFLIATLTAAIQELSIELKNVKNELTVLKNKG